MCLFLGYLSIIEQMLNLVLRYCCFKLLLLLMSLKCQSKHKVRLPLLILMKIWYINEEHDNSTQHLREGK